MGKKLYLTGALLSGLAHLPLLKDEEYTSYTIATLLWPVSALLWASYVRYALWGSMMHKQAFLNKSGIYADIDDELYKKLVEIVKKHDYGSTNS